MSALIVGSGWLAMLAVLARARGREELVARACHELRSPLTAARLALEAGRGPGVVELQLRRAVLALDDLAAARRGRRGSEIVEPLAVCEVLEGVRASWAPVAAGLGAELHVEPLPAVCFVRADRLRLGQAIGNLVANALEHGASPVTVRARPGDGLLRIEVTDAGPGLPAPVETLAAQARAGRGRSGRGLAISLSVARGLGGRLSAAPCARGARLVLDMPAIGAVGSVAVDGNASPCEGGGPAAAAAAEAPSGDASGDSAEAPPPTARRAGPPLMNRLPHLRGFAR